MIRFSLLRSLKEVLAQRVAGPFQGSLLRSSASRWGAVLVVSAGLVSLRCAAGGDAMEGPAASGGSSGEPRDEIDLTIGSNLGGDGATNGRLDPLCGIGACVPDDSAGCGVLGGAGGMGALGEAGGLSYDPGELADHGTACQVAPAADCEGISCSVERTCSPAGSSEQGEPCVAASDCAPGLACVGDGVSGLCRPYCCKGSERSCDDGFFCEERRLTAHPGVYVPVCMPVDDCPLTDPYPCPEGRSCACQDGRACVVVRADGRTACTEPGTGQTGDPCTGKEGAECAYGFVCSPSAGCLKLCSKVSDDSGCPDGAKCHDVSEFPEDLGVCPVASSGSPASK